MNEEFPIKKCSPTGRVFSVHVDPNENNLIVASCLSGEHLSIFPRRC